MRGEVTGDGSTTISQSAAIQIKPGTKFSRTEAGNTHSLAIDAEGNLWGWGRNDDGQVNGNGIITDNQPNVTQIKPGTKFSQTSSHGSQSLAIDIENNLWGWGQNYFGEANGNGDTTPTQATAMKIKPGTKFSQTTAGSGYSMAIDTEGDFWGWGNNWTGAILGNGDTTSSQLTAVRAVTQLQTPTPIITSVKFDDIEDLSFTVNSNNEITAITPPHKAGTVDVVLTTIDNQTITLINGYTYNGDSTPPDPGDNNNDNDMLDIKVPNTGFKRLF